MPLDGEAHEVEWLRHSHTHVSEFCRPALKLSWLSKEARLPARAFFPNHTSGGGSTPSARNRGKRKERGIREDMWVDCEQLGKLSVLNPSSWESQR